MAQYRRSGAERSWPQLATNERQVRDKMTRGNFVTALNAHRRKGCKEVSKTINRRKKMLWSSFFQNLFPSIRPLVLFRLDSPLTSTNITAVKDCYLLCNCCSYKLQGLAASLPINPVYPSLPIHAVYPSLPIHQVYPSLPIYQVYLSLPIHPVYPSLPMLPARRIQPFRETPVAIQSPKMCGNKPFKHKKYSIAQEYTVREKQTKR